MPEPPSASTTRPDLTRILLAVRLIAMLVIGVLRIVRPLLLPIIGATMSPRERYSNRVG